jgi:hypothetical protein
MSTGNSGNSHESLVSCIEIVYFGYCSKKCERRMVVSAQHYSKKLPADLKPDSDDSKEYSRAVNDLFKISNKGVYVKAELAHCMVKRIFENMKVVDCVKLFGISKTVMNRELSKVLQNFQVPVRAELLKLERQVVVEYVHQLVGSKLERGGQFLCSQVQILM